MFQVLHHCNTKVDLHTTEGIMPSEIHLHCKNQLLHKLHISQRHTVYTANPPHQKHFIFVYHAFFFCFLSMFSMFSRVSKFLNISAAGDIK